MPRPAQLKFPRPYSLLTVLLFALLSGACGRPHAQPPIAERRPTTRQSHGETRTDDYAWLRDRNNPEVITYLEAENKYTETMTAHTKGLQDTLYREMKNRIKETDETVPYKVDDYFYYTRTEKGKQYQVHCRKKDNLRSPEEITLDPNELAKGQKFFQLGVVEVSPDHKLLAYSENSDGSEAYTVHVKKLDTGELLSDLIPNTYYGLEWANDNRTFFYTTLDDAKRPYKALRHRLGTDPKTDELVHHETDEKFHIEISKTRSRAYILLSLNSQITSEVRFLEADRPDSELRVIQPRTPGVEYRVAHHNDSFYIVTNEHAVNFKVMKTPVKSPSRENWVDVIPERRTVLVDSVDTFQHFFAIHERENGMKKLLIRSFREQADFHVEFPEPVYSYMPINNEEWDTWKIRVGYSSLVTPRSVYDYDIRLKRLFLLKRDEVLGGYDPDRYVTERTTATAVDDVNIPISLVYKKGLIRNGRNPTLLGGYGAYGMSSDPAFNPDRISLLDRGFIFAIAHIRGGEEMGRAWYHDGKLLNKKNTFTDFIACAEHLITENYTSPEFLAIRGGSAGGLLMGAVTNMRPDLFKAVVAHVPFVDALNTMLDPTLPLTVIEYEEWGNPNEKAFYDYMRTYSPYDNVEAKSYPNMLITAGLNDPRVSYWEPAKWTAKLRAMKTDDNVILLKTNMGAGHGGASGRYDRWREVAFETAFLVDTVGVRR